MNDMMVISKFFVLFFFPYFLSLIHSSSAQSHPDPLVASRVLDAHLQDYAFKSLSMPITGVAYDAQLPSNLNGIKVSAMRLRNDSLKKRGVKNYKEFEIPSGVIDHPYVERLVLLYQNLGNWSEKFYPFPGYSYLSPVLGLLAYNGTNLSASKLPELDLRASEKPILVKFNDVKLPLFGSLAKCVYFNLNGSVELNNVLPGNVCSTFKQGHFSVVVESKSNVPSPIPSDASVGENKKSKFRIVILCSVGGAILLIILVVLIGRVRKAIQRKKIAKLESEGDGNETLRITSIADLKAPFAIGIRTRPVIENDYIP